MTTLPRGLGRGLDALLGQHPAATTEGLVELPISVLAPHPHQPRQHFSEEALQELAASIAIHGVIQPLTVRPMDDGTYQIVAGERRWRACQMAGRSTVPCIVRPMDDSEALAIALVENLQREDLSPMEEARALETLRTTLNLTQDELADRVGKSRPAVANALRLLRLPEEVQAMLDGGQLSPGHGRALLSLNEADLMVRAAQEVLRRGLTVRQTEALVKHFPPTPKPPKPAPPEDIHAWVQRLASRLPCAVVVRGGSDRGEIVLRYRNPEERRQVAALLRNIIGEDA